MQAACVQLDACKCSADSDPTLALCVDSYKPPTWCVCAVLWSSEWSVKSGFFRGGYSEAPGSWFSISGRMVFSLGAHAHECYFDAQEILVLARVSFLLRTFCAFFNKNFFTSPIRLL